MFTGDRPVCPARYSPQGLSDLVQFADWGRPVSLGHPCACPGSPLTPFSQERRITRLKNQTNSWSRTSPSIARLGSLSGRRARGSRRQPEGRSYGFAANVCADIKPAAASSAVCLPVLGLESVAIRLAQPGPCRSARAPPPFCPSARRLACARPRCNAVRPVSACVTSCAGRVNARI